MRIAHVSYSDGRAGAYAAAYRLHTALRAADADSWMLTAQATRGDERVVTPRGLRRLWQRGSLQVDQLPGRLAGAAGFSSGWAPIGLPDRVARLQADIVHLHWVIGAAAVRELPLLHPPIVWTLHDLWPLTGGCHYPGDCTGFTAECGNCPLLRRSSEHDLSRRVWRHKAAHWADRPLTLVAPSRWMAAQIGRSSLFGRQQVHVIPNGLNLEVFRPQVRAAARAQLGLPADRKIVLFGAISSDSDRRKGFDLLQAALGYLANSAIGGTIDLALFGASAALPQPGLPLHSFGTLSDDAKLAQIYAAADVFVAPSREDNLPNTVAEALACGTPCVAFDVGGLPDLIGANQRGYLARPYDPQDLATGIAWVLEAPARYAAMAAAARRFAEAELSLPLMAERSLRLYGQVRGRG